MQETDVLQRMKERAGALVAQDLRSASIVLRHLRELIAEAHGAGHSHKAIHAALQAAGLQARWNTYKSCLVRMKKAAPHTRPPSPAPEAVRSSIPADSARCAGSIPLPVDPALTVSSPLATRVLDALAEAKQVASRDYAQIARDLHRKNRK